MKFLQKYGWLDRLEYQDWKEERWESLLQDLHIAHALLGSLLQR
jgi:hypothetical protein